MFSVRCFLDARRCEEAEGSLEFRGGGRAGNRDLGAHSLEMDPRLDDRLGAYGDRG